MQTQLRSSVRLLSTFKQVDFTNTEKAYASKTFTDLLRHYFVFKLFTIKPFVQHSNKLLHWAERLCGQKLFSALMRGTVYGQFVGGESIESLRPTIARLSSAGVHSILDYAVEEDLPDDQQVVLEQRLPQPEAGSPDFKPVRGEATQKVSARTFFYDGDDHCENNKNSFLQCIETAAQVTDDGTPLAAIKLTGLGRVEFLLKLSQAVVAGEKVYNDLTSGGQVLNVDSLAAGLRGYGVTLPEGRVEELFAELDIDNSGSISYQEWLNQFQPSRALHKLLTQNKELSQLLVALSPEDASQMTAVLGRSRCLADKAAELGVGLMVDAEQSYFQPAIRHIVVNILMPTYNVGSHPVVYNTQQAYLKSAERSLLLDLAQSEQGGWCYGVKLVRGAYLTQEREKADSETRESPIWDSKPETDACYNKLLDILIQHAVTGNVHAMVASHNLDSIKFALSRMDAVGLSKDSGQVVFGQLLGMCDHITFPLGAAGYGAYKYVPYGPVNEVMPYLVRRAHENSSLMSSQTAQQELSLLSAEIRRRLSS